MALFVKTKARKMLFIALLAVIATWGIVLISNIERGSVNNIQASKGTLDLTKWNIEEQKTVRLNGEWEFYWRKFVDSKSEIKPDSYVPVPGVWNQYKLDGKKLPSFGYATYRLKVKVSEIKPLAIKIQPCSTAYELYIDDALIAKNGTVSKEKAGFVPQYKLVSKTFIPKSKEFMITVHISNYAYARGGMWYVSMIGTPSQIKNIDQSIIYRDFFLIGSFTTIMLFCLCLFYLGEKNFSILYFALLAFLIGLRTTLYGDRFFTQLVTSFRLIVITEYITLIWIPVFIALFLQSLIQNKNDKLHKIKILIVGIAVIMTILTLFTPVYIFTKLTSFVEIFGTIITLLSVFYLLLSTKQSKIMIAFGAFIFIVSGIYDMLYQNCVIPGFTEISPVGFYIMLSIWVVILAKEYAAAIKNTKISIEKAHNAEIAFLQAQIKPHFLYNALNVITALCRKNPDMAEEVVINLSKYLRKSFDFKTLESFVPLRREVELIKAYLSIEKVRFGDKLTVEYDIDNQLEGVLIPPLIIQPLIENSVRHGIFEKTEGGKISLKINKVSDEVQFCVTDDGKGMSREKVETILNGSQDGIGLGLWNVNRRLKMFYGTGLIMESQEEIGTRVSFKIPFKTNIEKKKKKG